MSACHAEDRGFESRRFRSIISRIQCNLSHCILLSVLAATTLSGQLTERTHLTLPVITPPLPDVDGLSLNGTGLVVVRPLAHDREICPS